MRLAATARAGSGATAQAAWPRRRGLTAVIVGSALTLAACGSSGSGPASSNNPGARVFAQAGCGNCHTLAAAGTTGTLGPDLDQLKPSVSLVERQVTHGGGPMPAFAGRLSGAQIHEVAQYVASASGRS